MNSVNANAIRTRKRPAHPVPVRRHNRPTILHVTVCVMPRRDLLGTPEVQNALVDTWTKADAWCVGYYMIMPDHVHFFCAPGTVAFPPIRKWVAYWKRLTGIGLPCLKGQWQPDCWDTQIRSGEHYEQKLEYVRNNPVRKGLVNDPHAWPFQGHVHELPWIGG